MSTEDKEMIDREYGGDLAKAAKAFGAVKIYLYRNRGNLVYKFIRDREMELAFLRSPFVEDPRVVWPE